MSTAGLMRSEMRARDPTARARASMRGDLLDALDLDGADARVAGADREVELVVALGDAAEDDARRAIRRSASASASSAPLTTSAPQPVAASASHDRSGAVRLHGVGDEVRRAVERGAQLAPPRARSRRDRRRTPACRTARRERCPRARQPPSSRTPSGRRVVGMRGHGVTARAAKSKRLSTELAFAASLPRCSAPATHDDPPHEARLHARSRVRLGRGASKALIDAGHGRRALQLLARHARGARRAPRAPAQGERRGEEARRGAAGPLRPEDPHRHLRGAVRSQDRRRDRRSSRARATPDDPNVIPIQYEGLAADVRVGDSILFDDGRIVLQVDRHRARQGRHATVDAGRRHAQQRRRPPADAHACASARSPRRTRPTSLFGLSHRRRLRRALVRAPRRRPPPRPRDLPGVGQAHAHHREDRDARRGREPRERRRRLRRRDGRARRSRRRVPARARPRHPAADPARRAPRAPPRHRRDRDAPVDDQEHAPHARRGERRRERRLRRHRRGHALRRDRERRLPDARRAA